MKRSEKVEQGKAVYERYTAKQRKDMKQGRLIGTVMIAVGIVVCFRYLMTGILFIGGGALLLLMNQAARKQMQREFAKVGDEEAFFAQIGSPDAKEYDEFGLLLTKDYVMREAHVVEIYRFRDMDKFEVGLAGTRLKKLFLTDRSGKRHEICQTVSGDGRQRMFDEVYEFVRSRLPVRK